MPSHLKKLVRARMEKTGESYQQALRHVRGDHDEADVSKPDSRLSEERASRSRTVADTAFSIAVVRAEEGQRPPTERLFDDPYASFFAAAGAHAAESTQRFLDLPFFRDGVRLRTRYIDDAVRKGLNAGLDQLVLLGAGFDARGLRMPEVDARGTSVYEIDTAQQLARKRGVLSAAGVKVPARVRYVPVDFDAPDFATSLTSALEEKGFRTGTGALFVWEGVIGYIDDATIDHSLRFMANAGGAGTRLLFTFGHVGFESDTATDRTRRAGFRSCEEMAGDELWRRYLPGEPHPNAWVTRVATAIL